MFALLLVFTPDWNHDGAVRTIICVFETFEDMVDFTDSDAAKHELELHAREYKSDRNGWDYWENTSHVQAN